MITSRSVMVGWLALGAGLVGGATSCADPSALGVAPEAVGAAAAASSDSLFIGDQLVQDPSAVSDLVQRFNATTGAPLGAFTQQPPPPIPDVDDNDPLHGVRGLVFRPGNAGEDGNLLVVNQNANLPKNGEVHQYQGFNGAYQDDLVNDEQQFAPFAPRGMVLGGDNILYVADFGNPFTTNPTFTPPAASGRLARYDGTSGSFLGDLDLTHLNGPFFPRGVVLGPDGKLYVSNFTDPARNRGGQILRFNPHTGRFVDVFVEGATCSCRNVTGCDPALGCDLTRPEGLVFAPDGRLFVASFRRDQSDNDKILVFNHVGQLVDQIDLDARNLPAADRTFAQALLFGPDGDLFVPISSTGEVRKYNVTTHQPTVFIKTGVLTQPWYLTFCNTDPATLAYQAGPSRCPTH